MHRTHKIAIVERLENEGFFMLRESVPQLATALSVTRHSIYNYLSEVRGNADAAAPSSPKDPK